MPRVLFVSTSTSVGGAEKTLFTLATHLDRQEFQVTGTVSLKPPGHYAHRLAEQHIKTKSLGLRGWPALRDCRALERVIREERPDLVHAIMYQAIQLCRFVKRRANLPFRLISSPRVNYRSRSYGTLLLDRWLKAADDLLITESNASREFLIRKLGYAEGRVKTIYNGVDIPPATASQTTRKRMRLQLGLAHDETLLLAMGRLDVQKGHGVLIDAMAELGRSRKARCVIIGDGPLRDRLRAQIRNRGLGRMVQLPGERGDVLSWLAACDVFVLPSLWEGLPNALLEAMALGLPVAASRVDGVPEVVTSGQNGLLVEPRDPAALAGAIASLIDEPELRARLGRDARTRITEGFPLSAMISGYAAAYRSVLAGPAI